MVLILDVQRTILSIPCVVQSSICTIMSDLEFNRKASAGLPA